MSHIVITFVSNVLFKKRKHRNRVLPQQKVLFKIRKTSFVNLTLLKERETEYEPEVGDKPE